MKEDDGAHRVGRARVLQSGGEYMKGETGSPVLRVSGRAAAGNRCWSVVHPRVARRQARSRLDGRLLGLKVLDGGLDGILGEHGAVQLHGRQLQVPRNVRVGDGGRCRARATGRGAGRGALPNYIKGYAAVTPSDVRDVVTRHIDGKVPLTIEVVPEGAH